MKLSTVMLSTSDCQRQFTNELQMQREAVFAVENSWVAQSELQRVFLKKKKKKTPLQVFLAFLSTGFLTVDIDNSNEINATSRNLERAGRDLARRPWLVLTQITPRSLSREHALVTTPRMASWSRGLFSLGHFFVYQTLDLTETSCSCRTKMAPKP